MTTETKAKILVIDDDETVLMHVERILEQNNYSFVCASNGKEGLGKALTEQPEIIILDRQMPEMDGNETLMRLKTDNNTKNIPVVMLTGDERASDIQTSFELGAEDYIVKPFDVDNFLLRLKKLLKK